MGYYNFYDCNGGGCNNKNPKNFTPKENAEDSENRLELFLSKLDNQPEITGDWIRPTDWLAMPTIVSTDDTFIGLYAIFPNESNFAAFTFTTSAGQYQVDWGDGNVTLHNSGVAAEYTYNYSTYDVGNITLSSNGYKQAIIKVTAVSGLLTTCNFNVRYTGQTVSYATGFLDCILSMPNASSGTSIVFGASNVVHAYCERFDIKTIGGCTSLANMFLNCLNLQFVSLSDTSNVTDMNSMFNFCLCLKTVPLFDTSNVTNMSSMFRECVSLQTLPLFDTANVTSMAAMFFNCRTIQEIPFFDTSAVTNMSNMIENCRSISTVPLFNTSNVTSMFGMFVQCYALKTVPLFDTSKVVNMDRTFIGCTALINLPNFNTPLVTNMNSMVESCYTLQSIPALSTASMTSASGSNFNNFAASCFSLDRCQMSFERNVAFTNAQLSKTALEEIFTNLRSRTGTSATITITGNYGADTAVSRTFTITNGSTTITTADTSGLVAGMQVTGTGSPLTTAVAVTFQDAGDTVTLLSHGLENGDEVSFATVVTTTGIILNTIYYVINKTTDTFQLATSVGGSPVALTTNGTGTMRHRTEIVSIVPNTSITMSRPMRGTGNQTLAFRLLKTGTALLKNWAVTG